MAAKLNAYDDGADSEFNRRKPYGVNKYGLIEEKGIASAFAPDVFKAHNNDRYWFMWDYWITGPDGWTWKQMQAAGVPPLRDYVSKGLASEK